MKNFFDTHLTPRARWWLVGLLAFVGLLLVFHAGYVFGERAMRPFPDRDDAFQGDFRPSFGPFGGPALPHVFVTRGGGLVGIVSTVAPPMLTITLRDGSTTTARVGTTTRVELDPNADDDATTTLLPGERIIIIGHQDSQGAVEADLVHILP